MSRPLSKSTYYYKLNRRIPNGTYGGVRGKSIQYFIEKFSLLDSRYEFFFTFIFLVEEGGIFVDLYEVRKDLSLGIPLTQLNLRVTDYARVSTDHLEQKKSLQNQVEHFEEFIKQNPNWTYIEGYVDDGISGTSDVKRDQFMKMIEDARLGKFDLIVTKEISRFSRNTLDSIKYTRELLGYGVAVLFVNDNINTALPDSELRLTIMASMAQDEIRRLSERVKFGMRRAIERGDILGNDLLFGYKKNKENGKLELQLEESLVVGRIYDLYAIQELSLSRIAKILNEENLKTSLGKKWKVTQLSRMIENPKYKGYYCGKKSEIIDYMTKRVQKFEKKDWVLYEDQEKIPPIVTEELWLRANERLEKRKKKSCHSQNRYLYSGKILCKEHKAIFHRREFRKKKRDVTWVCSLYLKEGKKVCDSPNLRETELDYIMADLIKKLNIDCLEIQAILMNYYKRASFLEDFLVSLKAKEKEIETIQLKKEKLLDLYLKESLDNQEFQERNEQFNEQIKTLNEDIKKIKEMKDKQKEKEESEELSCILKSKINDKRVNDKIIHLILHHMVVSKVNQPQERK